MNSSTSIEATPKNESIQKRRLVGCLALAALLFLTWFLWQLFGPNPPIIVSKQTTYITEPLRPNGTPDYIKLVGDKLREGVTKENNAAVLMWQAFGPRGNDEGIPENWQQVTRELDLPPIDTSKCLTDPYGDEVCKRVEAWFVANHPAWKQTIANPPAIQDGDASTSFLAYELIGRANDAPWGREQLLPLAEWLDANNDAIDLLEAGSHRPRLYTPFEPAEPGEENSLLSHLPMNGIMRARETARVLGIRAMYRLGERRHSEAWQDLLAIHRWARLIGQGPTVVEQLVAVAIDGIACSADAALLSSDDLPAYVAQKIQRDLDSLSPTADFARSLDEGERLYFLDSIIHSRNQGIGAFVAENFQFDFDTGEPKPPDWSNQLLNLVRADWNVGLEEGNRYYDRFAAAARLPNYPERRQQLRQLGREISGHASSLQKPTNWVLATFIPAKRNEMLGSAMFAALAPGFSATPEALDRSSATLDLTRLAAALAVHRATHGSYPDRLEQLVPDVIPKLPTDLFHNKPFIYQRDADGYLLYSCGPNGNDEGGSGQFSSKLAGRPIDSLPESEQAAAREQIPGTADDISIRIPRPPFSLPNPPSKP